MKLLNRILRVLIHIFRSKNNESQPGKKYEIPDED